MTEAWTTREPPLRAQLVVGLGPVAAALGRRVLQDPELQLEGAAAPGLLVLRGDTEALPWVDGVVYLGQDPEAPGLYLPTTQRPPLPSALLLQALRRAHRTEGPLGLLPAPLRVLPLSQCRALHGPALSAWLAQEPR